MSSFPFTLGPSGSIFPMSGNPYWSRIQLFEIQGSPAKNYALLAFKPGLPLQASELSEIQEINALNTSLTATMVSLWPIHLPGHSGEGPIYGPGWNGTTPLYPEFDVQNTTTNMIGYTGGVISIRQGWYLVTVKSSNLKHWIYLDTGYTRSIPDVSGPNTQYLGFTAQYEIIKPTQDPSLYDNSSGTTITTGSPAGADRIKVNISAPFWTTNPSSNDFSPIAKRINNTDPILYMNNVKVPRE